MGKDLAVVPWAGTLERRFPNLFVAKVRESEWAAVDGFIPHRPLGNLKRFCPNLFNISELPSHFSLGLK